jgi:hypothetical protein
VLGVVLADELVDAFDAVHFLNLDCLLYLFWNWVLWIGCWGWHLFGLLRGFTFDLVNCDHVLDLSIEIVDV